MSKCARSHRKREDKTIEKQAEPWNCIFGISKVGIWLNGAKGELHVCHSQVPWQLGFLSMETTYFGKANMRRKYSKQKLFSITLREVLREVLEDPRPQIMEQNYEREMLSYV